MSTDDRKPSAYHLRKEMARLEGEIRLWTAVDPALYAEKIEDCKTRLKELMA